MAAVRSYLLTDQNRFRADTSKHWEEFICKVSKKKKKKKNASHGSGGDAITAKIKDGCRWPYLSMDRNQFRAVTTKALGKQLRQVSGKKNNNKKTKTKKKKTKKKKRSRRRGDNKIFTVIGKGQSAILKMAAVRPYLLTDYNRFRGDTSRQWDEFTFRFWQNSSSVFGRRCDNGENQRWLWYFFFGRTNGRRMVLCGINSTDK